VTIPEAGDPPAASDETDDEIQVPCSDDVKPSLDNLDNFDWTYCSFGLQRIWRALNIGEDRFNTTSSLSEAASFFGDLDRDGHPDRILRLTLRNATDSTVRFVVMKYAPSQSPNQWLPLAHLNISEFHLAPEPRVVTGKHSSWLVLDNIERSWMPEYLQEDEEWYELRQKKLVSVLSFPIEVDAVSESQPAAHRQVHAESLVIEDGTNERINVSLTATSVSSNGPRSEIHHAVSFIEESSSNRFVFDPLHSDISEAAYRATVSFKSNRVSSN
jgi:hypothetical protein